MWYGISLFSSNPIKNCQDTPSNLLTSTVVRSALLCKIVTECPAFKLSSNLHKKESRLFGNTCALPSGPTSFASAVHNFS